MLPIISQYQLLATFTMHVNNGISGIDLSSARGCTDVCGIVEKAHRRARDLDSAYSHSHSYAVAIPSSYGAGSRAKALSSNYT